MTTVVSLGPTDTPIDGVSSLSFTRGLLNFEKDFRVKSNNGKEVVLTNITSPIDRPENIRVAYSDVANIYSGTGIDPSVYAPTTRGVSLLSQVTEVISVTKSEDLSYRVDIPASAHLVIKTAASEYITADIILQIVGRLLSSLYDSGSVSTNRLNAILRGSLVPTEL